MPDSAPALWGRHTAIERCGEPVARGVYASERLSHGEAGKIGVPFYGTYATHRHGAGRFYEVRERFRF